MRSLKFRAWSNDDNRYCDFVTLDEDGRWIGWIKSCGIYLTADDIILEQDTGLKDKNGKEIYEGDIVRFYYKGKIVGDFKVKYDEEVAWFLGENLVKNEDGVKTEESFFLSEYQSVRVTGNVHENDKGGK